MNRIYASMKSIASFVPQNCIKNDDFKDFIDTNDEWITKRTGIKTRYFASKNENASDLGVRACDVAIARAGLKASDIDMVICATLSPDYLGMPSTACLIASKLGISNKPAFDISAACSGFIYLLSMAKAFVESGSAKNILIVGAEKISSVLDFSDRGTCILFGDGAGASVISATSDENKRIIDVKISSDGKFSDYLEMNRAPSYSFFDIKDVKNHSLDSINQHIKAYKCNIGGIKMRGNETFKLAVKTLASDVSEILSENAINPNDISFFIPHQANLRIINAVGDMIAIPREKIVLTIQKYGNTSAASIPMAIDEIYANGSLQNGDLLLLDAFGGGLTWGSALLYFNGRN